MRTILILSALLLSMAGNLMAGSGYDRCVKEEAALKAKEKDACSGLSYVLNPSGCFATRKALKEYASGKCRKIGVSEKVDLNAPAVVPAKNNTPAPTVERAGQAAPVKPAPELPPKEIARERPEDEISRLKEEIGRLTAENERLRQRCRE